MATENEEQLYLLYFYTEKNSHTNGYHIQAWLHNLSIDVHYLIKFARLTSDLAQAILNVFFLPSPFVNRNLRRFSRSNTSCFS